MNMTNAYVDDLTCDFQISLIFNVLDLSKFHGSDGIVRCLMEWIFLIGCFEAKRSHWQIYGQGEGLI